VTSMHDADAVPAASPSRQVSRGTMVWAVGRRDNCTAAEAKTWLPRDAERPMANFGSKRADLFDDADGRAWVGKGGCPGAPRRRGGLFWRRRGGPRSGRLSFGAAAVGPGGSRAGGGRFDLGDCDRFDGHEAAHKDDGARDAARAILPAPNAPRANSEYPGGVAWREAKRAECRAEFGRGGGALVSLLEVFSKAGRCFLPSRVARLDEDRHRSVPDLESRS